MTEREYDAVIVTSANALRAIEAQLQATGCSNCRCLRSADIPPTPRADAGFNQVIAAKGDARALSDLVLARVKTKQLKKAATLLYLAGADLARDLAGELREHGLTVVTQTTYRMVPRVQPAARRM